jgi:hypothetical protein
MRRKFGSLLLSVVLFSSCGPQDPVPPPAPGTPVATASAEVKTDEVKVVLRVTGIAHLVEVAAKERLLLVPNLMGDINHVPLLLVNSGYTVDKKLLNQYRVVDLGAGTFGEAFNFRVFPVGYEIDLKASGLDLSAPALDLDETGDSNDADCPGGGVTADSLHWLPHLVKVAKVNSGTPKTKKAHVGTDPSPVDVVTRIEIKDGKLRSDLRSNRKFEFDLDNVEGNDKIQAVADALIYTFKVKLAAGQPFVLKGRRFKANVSDAEKTIDIASITPKSNQVEIVLANVVTESFFAPRATDEIPHFHHYYDSVDGDLKMPAPKFLKAKICGNPNDGGTECGPDRTPAP